MPKEPIGLRHQKPPNEERLVAKELAKAVKPIPASCKPDRRYRTPERVAHRGNGFYALSKGANIHAAKTYSLDYRSQWD